MERVRRAWDFFVCSPVWLQSFSSWLSSLRSIGSSKVPDPSNATLIQFKDWTLRIRETSSAEPRFLLLIHGLTGDENSMWVFARNLSADYLMVAPRAPYATEPSGYSWRNKFDDSEFGRPSLDQLRTSAEALMQLVDEYSASV